MTKKRVLLRGLGALLSVLSLCLGTLTYVTSAGCATFGGQIDRAQRARLEQTGRYRDGAFQNLEPTSLLGEGSGHSWLEFVLGNGQLRRPTCALPMDGEVAAKLRAPPLSGLRITWLGHSTTLIELDGKVLLTDPMWSARASPFSVAGPERFHPPPLALSELPRLDAVAISHDHYDHLDMETIQALAKTGVTFHVALGVGAHLERWGVPAAQWVEHDWWTPADLGGGVFLVATPARHFSGRGLWNRNPTLWSSWALVGPRHRIYFSGDTGQTQQFTDIMQRLGPFDVALLEIGQYHPSWGDIHLGPVGALEAHARLGARRLLPIHWSTFELGLHAWSEPAETLVTEAARSGVTVLTPRLGEPLEPDANPATERWWRAYPPLSASCPKGAAMSRAKRLEDWPL